MKAWRDAATVVLIMISLVLLSGYRLHGADVAGYSLVKGQFYVQTDANTLQLDPDFSFSILGSVDLTDFDTVTDASLRLPDGSVEAMDNLGDTWTFLDTRETFAELNADYPWGTYTLSFDTVNDGSFSCPLPFTNRPLPPLARLLNFNASQAVNPGKPLTLYFDFEEPPRSNDFVQVYITEGHAVIFSTPDLGEPGALDIQARSITIPVDTMNVARFYGLNFEITRPTPAATCVPGAQGAVGTLSSTEVIMSTMLPPVLRLHSRPADGSLSVEVRSEPGRKLVLEASDDLRTWTSVATNWVASETNVFTLPVAGQGMRIFRAHGE